MTAGTAGEIAGLPRRLLSLVYETLLVVAVALVGMFPLVILTNSLDPLLKRPLHQVFLVLLVGIYFTWQWTRGGQTLPMRTWRLKLVTREGNPVTWSQGVRRFVFAVAGTVFCGGGFVWALFDRDRQFLHDRLARTKIIYAPATRSSPPRR